MTDLGEVGRGEGLGLGLGLVGRGDGLEQVSRTDALGKSVAATGWARPSRAPFPSPARRGKGCP